MKALHNVLFCILEVGSIGRRLVNILCITNWLTSS